MLGFRDQSWLVQNTEVLTVSGWINVKALELGTPVITMKNGKYLEDCIIGIGKCKPRTKIRVYKTEEGIIKAKNLLLNINSTHHLEDYEGELFHLTTKNNLLIVRNYNEVEGLKTINNDYYIIWTAKSK